MLKRIVIVGASVMCLAGVAIMPMQAVARSTSRAHVTKDCPPGSGDQQYCEKHCVVPNLHDLTLDAARHKLLEAGCTLGRIEIIGNGPRSGFIVETQNPPAGSVRRFHFAVNVAVLKGRHGNKHG